MRLIIILVEPARAENVGAAARALKTMGFAELRIVGSEAHLQPAARYVAHGSTDIIENAQRYGELAEALHDVDFTVATTARSRARYRYYATPQQLLPLLEERRQWMSTAALVFGREDSGLTNEELELADVLTGIPMASDYPSLNLGQAVMVYCWQLASLAGVKAGNSAIADTGQLDALRRRINALLAKLAVADDRKMADWLQQRLGFLDQRDTVMLHRLLHDIEKKLPE
ncbi:tRNA/rRNA methyltransferase [Enterobacteriaceae bacterium YMB-R22]|uniref:tRNA/rRNA methyltransferase n=1 Tax=Tenebrionicola larvae TaxID=2815733 RepID=UPI002011380A|nr:tRNA/rRNA methyltransferase [Tenebrionicola larvae]MBV4412431.1 tRNA/rRNA methyltransferase [Tenebrionicola larvae]